MAHLYKDYIFKDACLICLPVMLSSAKEQRVQALMLTLVDLNLMVLDLDLMYIPSTHLVHF